MIRQLLLSGMLAGLVAALLAVAFARVAVEPLIDRAIAVEATSAAAHGEVEEPELVSRATQRGAGLLVATAVYGAAFGGLFALAFAALRIRVLGGDARPAALRLAAIVFVTVCLVPQLKYPPNPPAVGLHETIQLRTAAYFGMVALSLLAAGAATIAARRARPSVGAFDAALAGCFVYAVLALVAAAALPGIDEVPATFPATLLWRFRTGALATQALLWAAIGLVFGWLARRSLGETR